MTGTGGSRRASGWILLTAGFSAVSVGCASRVPVAPLETDSVTVGSLRIVSSVAAIGSDQLRVDLGITNVSGSLNQLDFPMGCPVIVRIYRNNVGAVPAAWDQALPREGAECALGVRRVPLRPGEQTVVSSWLNKLEILGDSLPDATYYATATFDLQGGPPIIVPVGSLRLSRRR